MKICFVQKQAFPYFGVMSLAGSLKAAGIDTDAVITNLERDFIATLREIRPDILAVSLLSTEHTWLEQTTLQIKKSFPHTPLIVGGIHAILYPEKVLRIAAVDAVCTGDGEQTIEAFCRAVQSGEEFRHIPGIGYRDGDSIVINARAPLHGDLDTCREDRQVYYRRYQMLRNDELKQFIASRGCPYRCSFCFNERLHILFPQQMGRVRVKSPRHLIEEIEAVKKSSPIGAIFFADDLFTAEPQWLRAFCELYRQRIALPFMCITRADRMDLETARVLKDAGCHTVSFGVETGNETLRKNLLNKNITDCQIENCAAQLHAEGIRVQTSNMFCLPDETIEDALATVRLNIRIKADFVFTPLFLPFPGTRLADYCIANGYLPKDFGFDHLPQSFLTHSILNLPDRRKIENLQRIAYFLVRHPWLYPPAETLIRTFTCSWIYYPFVFLATLLRYKEERGLSMYGAVRFLWRFRKSF